MLVSLLSIYSISSGVFDESVKKHLLTIVFSITFSLFIAKIKPQFIYDNILIIYVLVLCLLFVTLFMGHKAMGAQRWINLGVLNLQPAEFMKIVVILALAQYFHNVHSNFINKFSVWIIPFLLVLLPVALIIKQPNLGTAIIIALNAIMIIYLAGIRSIYFIIAGFLCVAAVPVAWFALHDYQQQRVLTFLDPGSDPLGAGYNILQSIISIGSGGLYGKGFIQGSQNQLKFLPENHTDFIFALVAEEGGFLMCLLVFFLYMALLFLLLIFSHKCASQFQRLFIGGFAALLFIHVGINIAMISGLLPVVGVPLPFLSFGGSNILAMSIGAGLVINCFLNKEWVYR
jgi:rod shape determining protein RodA